MDAREKEARYLAELDARIVGLVPDGERNCFVSETAFYLENTARTAVLRGASYEDAVQSAIEHQGSFANVADEYVERYYENEIDSSVYKTLGRSNTTAIAIFGLANAFYMAFLQLKIYFVDPSALPIGPVEARKLFPEPLPYPDFSWQFYVTIGYPLIAPWIAGLICGKYIPVRAEKAVFSMQLLMIIMVFLMGVSLLPDRDALLYGVLLTVYWLPVGCLSAHFSSSFFRWLRRRKLERNGWSPSPSTSIQEVHP